MSNFGKGSDAGGVRKLFTGVENFKVIAINPTKEQLEKIYGREINYDPQYMNETKVSDGDGEREVKQIRLDFYLSNEDTQNPINTKISFYVSATHHKSQTGKLKVINDFGKTTWLTEEDIKAGSVPQNMSWYNTSGLKVARRGEEEVLDFIANLLNLPFDLSKLTDISDAYARVSKDEWNTIFGGDVTLFEKGIESTNNKVGVLLGVKTKQDGGLTQSAYTRLSLRQYTLHSKKADKFKWLLKNVLDAKANGAFGAVEFGSDDLALREFKITPTELSSNNAPQQLDAFEAVAQEESVTEKDSDWLEMD